MAWRVDNRCGSVMLDEATLALTVEFAGDVWKTRGPAGDEITVAVGPSAGSPSTLPAPGAGRSLSMPLSRAQDKRVSNYRSGVGSGFCLELGRLGDTDVRLVLLVILDDERPEVTVRLSAAEGDFRVQQLRWPGPMASSKPPGEQTSVIPLKQGVLLPGDWGRQFKFCHNACGGGAMYMPWFGQYAGGAGYLAIMQTPADASVAIDHPAGGPTAISVQHDSSLGGLSYARSVQYLFQSPCDFISLAKAYRAYVRSRGRFVSLQEKLLRTPSLADLIGSPVIHTHICYHVQPESRYYKPDDPAANHRVVGFAERADQLKRLGQRGLSAAYVHLDGWGCRGYDNLHPDCLPACVEAGGWKGFRYLADTCRQAGYRLALHDQYRDYFHDAASFDLRHAVWGADGKAPEWAIWFGGRQSLLCASVAWEYVRRNYDEIARQGVRIDGAYLDVFASVDPDECFNPEHPASRAECLDHRCRCFGLIRSRGLIISSEEPMDFALGHLDLVHWGPYPCWPKLHGRDVGLGVPAPLLALVYHDSLLLPWMTHNGQEAWGPQTDDNAAHAALCGAMPYLDIDPADEDLAKVGRLCRLHRRVAAQELVGHELLDPAGRRRRSVFADGTIVQADLDSGSWSCEGLPE